MGRRNEQLQVSREPLGHLLGRRGRRLWAMTLEKWRAAKRIAPKGKTIVYPTPPLLLQAEIWTDGGGFCFENSWGLFHRCPTLEEAEIDLFLDLLPFFEMEDSIINPPGGRIHLRP